MKFAQAINAIRPNAWGVLFVICGVALYFARENVAAGMLVTAGVALMNGADTGSQKKDKGETEP